MSVKFSIPFDMSHEVIRCAPLRKYCAKGANASASIKTLEVLAIKEGIKTIVEVWDQVERRVYVLKAEDVVAALYFCNESEFMGFKYKKLPVIQIKAELK